jgi:hypothetical protein
VSMSERKSVKRDDQMADRQPEIADELVGVDLSHFLGILSEIRAASPGLFSPRRERATPLPPTFRTGWEIWELPRWFRLPRMSRRGTRMDSLPVTILISSKCRSPLTTLKD